MLSGEEDPLDAIMEINPGAGGTESQDWASILLRMYLMWGEKNGFKVKEVNYQPGDVAGIRVRQMMLPYVLLPYKMNDRHRIHDTMQ